MRMKKIAATMIVAALSCGSAMSSMAAAWVTAGQSDWKYQLDDGSFMSDSWLKHTDGKWYFLGSDGVMKKGWYQANDQKWYFLNSSGSMQTGLIDVDGKVYYMEESVELFIGDKTLPNGSSYNFGLNGVTNGTPQTANKFKGNGDNASTENVPVVPSDSGDTQTPTIPAQAVDSVKELTEKVVTIEEEYEQVISKITVGSMEAISNTRANVPVNVDLKKAEAIANLDKTRDAVKAAANELIKDTTGPVTFALGGISRSFTTEEVQERLDEFAYKWVTEENLNLYGKNIGSIGVVVDGVNLTYKISLDF